MISKKIFNMFMIFSKPIPNNVIFTCIPFNNNNSYNYLCMLWHLSEEKGKGNLNVYKFIIQY